MMLTPPPLPLTPQRVARLAFLARRLTATVKKAHQDADKHGVSAAAVLRAWADRIDPKTAASIIAMEGLGRG